MSKFDELYESVLSVYKTSKQSKPTKLGKLDKSIKVPGFEVYVSGDVYDFVEVPKNGDYKVSSDAPLIYTYNITKGNLNMGNRELWDKREIRSGSKAFHKGKTDKMSIPNDLQGAIETITAHYNKYKKKNPGNPDLNTFSMQQMMRNK